MPWTGGALASTKTIVAENRAVSQQKIAPPLPAPGGGPGALAAVAQRAGME